LRFATHPSVSLDEAGGRFRHLGGLRRALGINGSRSSGTRAMSERRGLRLGRSVLAHSGTGADSVRLVMARSRAYATQPDRGVVRR
jgi:hypothetical protein